MFLDFARGCHFAFSDAGVFLTAVLTRRKNRERDRAMARGRGVSLMKDKTMGGDGKGLKGSDGRVSLGDAGGAGLAFRLSDGRARARACARGIEVTPAVTCFSDHRKIGAPAAAQAAGTRG